MRRIRQIILSAVAMLAVPGIVLASVLPEDRADILYHHYTGGGVDINGPSVLVRKQIGKSTSFNHKFAFFGVEHSHTHINNMARGKILPFFTFG